MRRAVYKQKRYFYKQKRYFYKQKHYFYKQKCHFYKQKCHFELVEKYSKGGMDRYISRQARDDRRDRLEMTEGIGSR